MGMKPLERLAAPRRSRQKTRNQVRARTQRALQEQRLKNLAKARRVRKKNLAAKKKETPQA